MATTPTVTATPTSLISHWVTLVKAHEKLLLAVVLALVVWHIGDKVYDAYGAHLKATQTADNAQITQLNQSNAQIAANLAELKATLAAKTVAANAKIAVSKQKLAQKEIEVAALPLPELSKEWETLIALPGSVTPQANGTIIVTTDAAHTTVSELEKVAPLTEQLIATQDKYDACIAVTQQQDKSITGLNEQVAAVTKARTDDAKVAKVAQHKSFMRGFKYGFITGVVATTAAVVAILH